MVAIGPVFAAVRPSQDAVLAVAARIGRLDIPGRLTPPENWHITLRYLGRVEAVTFERFLHGLAEVGRVPAFRVALGGIGAFPNPRRATVIWIGVTEGDEGLASLAGIAEESAVAAGLEPEERPYRAHLTLARVRPPADVTDLVGDPVPARWEVDRMIVYRSIPRGGAGVRYEPLESFDLAR